MQVGKNKFSNCRY